MVENKKILAVDDEDDILEILSFNLTGEGYVVDTATSAEEAMRKNLFSYDLFILDVMMGAMSGFRLAEKKRNTMYSLCFSGTQANYFPEQRYLPVSGVMM